MLGFRDVAPFFQALLSSRGAQSRTLGQGTETIRGFSQSHPQLQLVLPHDSLGWHGSHTTSPDCPWALGEFPWGLWAISHSGNTSCGHLRPLAGSS